MINSKPIRARARPASDAAIDGLFAGLAAGLLMGIVVILGGLLVGESPAAVLERFSTGHTTTPLSGGLMHLAVSVVYGIVFGLLAHALPSRVLRRLPGWLAGLLYGLLLLAVAVGALLPGLNSPLLEIPLWILALGHAVYGLVLGWRAYERP